MYRNLLYVHQENFCANKYLWGKFSYRPNPMKIILHKTNFTCSTHELKLYRGSIIELIARLVEMAWCGERKWCVLLQATMCIKLYGQQQSQKSWCVPERQWMWRIGTCSYAVKVMNKKPSLDTYQERFLNMFGVLTKRRFHMLELPYAGTSIRWKFHTLAVQWQAVGAIHCKSLRCKIIFAKKISLSLSEYENIFRPHWKKSLIWLTHRPHFEVSSTNFFRACTENFLYARMHT